MTIVEEVASALEGMSARARRNRGRSEEKSLAERGRGR
jgi:hypothetical protein